MTLKGRRFFSLPKSLADVLFPKTCQSCGDAFHEGLSNILCRACFDTMPVYEDPVCGHCGISLSMGAFEDAVSLRCRDCGEGSYFLDGVRAVGPYVGALRIAHHGFKFEGMEKLKVAIAKRMVESTIPAFWDKVGALVPVPLSPERERERGYNPAAHLAAEVSRAISVPVRLLLRKVKPTRPQMALTREERLKNPKGTYQVQPNRPVSEKIVLVDDVLTTGATLEECAKILKKSGVAWVGAIVFGRTPRY